MKRALLILFMGIEFCAMSQSDSLMKNFQRNLAISDIVETLSECNCMIIGMRGKLNEKEKKVVSRAQALLFGRNFRELDSLFDHGNALIQLYAFGGICVSFPDSLTEKHFEILYKKETVNLCQQRTDHLPRESIGVIAARMNESVARTKKEKEMQLAVQKKISDFVVKYATYPQTYESISFQGYHVYSTHDGESLEKIEDSEVYSVKHIFKIQNNEGKVGEYHARFKIDNKLTVVIIEEEESDTVSSFPPELKWWFEQFGRKLTKQDKKELGLED